jgi:hypothetical protein
MTAMPQMRTANTSLEVESLVSAMSFTAKRYNGDGRNIARPRMNGRLSPWL